MLLSYIRIIRRLLLKYRRINSLNVAGLTLGLAISIILGAYCANEYSYDSFNDKAGRIYQLWATIQMGPNEGKTSMFSAGAGENIKEKYPGVESFVRIRKLGTAYLQYSDHQKYVEKGIIFADSSLFQIFTFPLKEGDASSLSKPNSILISENMAIKYFGKEDPIGKSITYNENLILRVDGVFKNIPGKSSIKFDFVVSITTFKNLKEYQTEFSNPLLGLGAYQIYFLLNDRSVASKLSELIPKLINAFKINEYHFEPLAGAHVRNYGYDESNYVNLFAIIAIITFIVSVVNSINITTSQYIERSKEIVIRKINGASRGSIAYLFYAETFVITLISLVLSFALARVSLSVFQTTLSIEIHSNLFLQKPFVYFVALAFIFMVGTGGMYPAIVLSTTKPIFSLSSSFSHSKFTNNARRASIIFQFIISIILVLGVLIIQDQLSYIKRRDLGIDIKDILVLHLEPEEAKNYSGLRNELITMKGISDVGASTVSMYEDEPPLVMASRSDSLNDAALSMLIVDQFFIKTMKIGLIGNEGTDKQNSIILNETAVKSFSLNKEPIGSQLRIVKQLLTVTNVVKDYNYTSLRNKIGNLSISTVADTSKVFGFTGCHVYVKLLPGENLNEKLVGIEKTFKKWFPTSSFKYSYLEDTFWRDYKTENSLLDSFRLFTTVAILIACFGIIGLLIFNITNKMAEISIRKVLGADLFQLSYFLLKEIVAIILISMAIAIPFTIYFVNDWLQTFAYRTSISIATVFICFAIICLVTALIAFGFIKRASVTNPIKFLRKE